MRRRLLRLAALLAALATGAVAAPAPVLTSEGWGGLRIGMGEAEVVRRFGVVLAPDDGVNSFDCRESRLPGPSGITIMTEQGRVTRLTLYDASPVRTDRGLGIGSAATEVRRAYGTSIRATAHVYEDPPAQYLTWRPGRSRNGVRYEIGSDGRVAAIHAGRSIDYVEGCL